MKLFVGQIPKTMEEDAIRPVMEEFGVVKDIKVIRDKLTGAHRGITKKAWGRGDAGCSEKERERERGVRICKSRLMAQKGQTKRAQAIRKYTYCIVLITSFRMLFCHI